MCRRMLILLLLVMGLCLWVLFMIVTATPPPRPALEPLPVLEQPSNESREPHGDPSFDR